MICASSAYARGATGDGITIAVVDTGGPWNAAGSIINGEFDSDATEILKPNNSDYANSDSIPDDQEATHGHGVGVACMIRCDKGDGDMHGVAFDATLNFYKVFDDSGNFVSDTAAANALDDYEEGTWTPTINSGTMNTAYGYYTKIGRQVTISYYIIITTLGSSTTAVRLGGLPFTSQLATNGYGNGTGSIGYSTLSTYLNNTIDTCYIGQDGTSIQFYTMGGAAVSSNANASNDWIELSATYPAQ